MTINFGDVCFAVIICTIVTIVLYIASWYNYDHKEKDVSEFVGRKIEHSFLGRGNETAECIEYARFR